MKFFLISDNVDTITGMRLAGIEGVLVHEAEETKRVLLDAM
ncbi:MAG: ATP synthase subunit F, partial [Oscillospiraceae bacterium]|nr:ATP synthase subunit F [Oscillospiraceae bacterium]